MSETQKPTHVFGKKIHHKYVTLKKRQRMFKDRLITALNNGSHIQTQHGNVEMTKYAKKHPNPVSDKHRVSVMNRIVKGSSSKFHRTHDHYPTH